MKYINCTLYQYFYFRFESNMNKKINLDISIYRLYKAVETHLYSVLVFDTRVFNNVIICTAFGTGSFATLMYRAWCSVQGTIDDVGHIIEKV